MEYKCPYSIKDVTVQDGWDKTSFMEKVDEQLRLKRTHKYYRLVQGQMGVTGCSRAFFVVWTQKGQPHIEVIEFDAALWQDVVSKLTIFLKRIFKGRYLELDLFCTVCCVEGPALSQRSLMMTKITAYSVSPAICGFTGFA